ncbi:MAG: hypothetical protein AAF184_16865 [Pseudomonadota bacterium]
MPTFDAFGRVLTVERRNDAWVVFDKSTEGKRRRAHDVVVPVDTPESELLQSLDDLLHESARPGFTRVRRLGED